MFKTLFATILVFTFLIFPKTSNAQSDFSLVSFKQLNDSIDFTENQGKKTLFLKAYINKAKREKNTEELMQGYRRIMSNLPQKEAIVYSDSLLHTAFQSKSDTEIAAAYQSIATLYYTFKDYKSSLDANLLAEEYVLKTDNTYNLYKIRNGIARIKYYIGDTKEALRLYIGAEEYYASQGGINNQLGQLNSITSISKCFIALEDWENTHRYNQKGLTLSTLIDNQDEKAYWENYFLLLEGIYFFHQRDFESAKKMLNQSVAMFVAEKDDINEHIAHLYIGKVYWEQNQHDKAIEYFKKISTLFIQKKQVNNTLREAFILLIAYYKEEKNLEEQLVYTNQLIEVDQLLNDQYKVLENKIRSEHDSRQILETKQKLEQQIKQQQVKSKILTYASISLIAALLGYYVWNRKKAKRKTIPSTKDLINDTPNSTSTIIEEEEYLATNNFNEEELLIEDININETIVAEILQKLEQFEIEKQFLRQDISLKVLAEEWNTNTSYLSKVINTYKKNNFKQYLNDLRIDYAYEKLKESNSLRSYKTDALAEYFGFNNVRSFTDAFSTRKGIKLSSYIKECVQSEV